MQSPEFNQPRWISTSILVSAGFVIFALVLSAVFQPSIRLLHTFQALIYVAVTIFSFRNSPWGFGAGCLISAFWNYIFIRAAPAELWEFFAGRLFRADLALQEAVLGAHCLLIIACLAGSVRLRPGAKGWVEFVAGGVLAIGYLVLIIVTMGPEYMQPTLKRAFGL